MIYTYTGLPTYQGQNGYAAVGTTLTLELTDAAVASGSFTLSGYGSLGSASYTGDVSGLVSFTTDAPFTATQAGIDGGGAFSISLVFGSNRAILSDTISYEGLDGDGTLSGTGALTFGTIGSDSPGCDSDASSGLCTVSGAFATRVTTTQAAVPEPTSSGLLALPAGVLALVMAWRRRGARSA